MFMQTKTAKSVVGLTLSVDSSQTLTPSEYIKRRGFGFIRFLSNLFFIFYFSFIYIIFVDA